MGTRTALAVAILFTGALARGQNARTMTAQEAAEFVADALLSGTIVARCDERKAWIDHDLWQSFGVIGKKDATLLRKDVTHAIWMTCAGLAGVTSEANAPDLDLYDMQETEKKLATYSFRRGFRVDVERTFTQTEPRNIETEQMTEKVAPTPQDRDFFKAKHNQEFSLGDFSYKVLSVAVVRAIGEKPTRRAALEGHSFFIINYDVVSHEEHNNEWWVFELSRVFMIHSGTERYFIDDNATSLLVDTFGSRQINLVPGEYTRNVAVFEVPTHAIQHNFEIWVSERNGRKTATLTLHSGGTLGAPEKQKSKSRPQGRLRQSNEATQETNYEERRRQIIMERPWGTSQSDYDLDNYSR